MRTLYTVGKAALLDYANQLDKEADGASDDAQFLRSVAEHRSVSVRREILNDHGWDVRTLKDWKTNN